MPIDYLKIYTEMVLYYNESLKADDLSVKVRRKWELLQPYIFRMLQWEQKEVFPYAVTISPKSSPLLKNKSVTQQYNLMCAFIKQSIPLYSNKYFFTFEFYKDGLNIHTHGFVNFRTANDVKQFKKSNRQHFNILLKPRERDCLTDVKLLGGDDTARKRWIGYCYKEMYHSIVNDIPPIYRWDDEFIPLPIVKIKRKFIIDTDELLSYPDPESVLKGLANQHWNEYASYGWKPRPPTQVEYELESEDESSSEEPDKEYYEYLRLKSKFENKNI